MLSWSIMVISNSFWSVWLLGLWRVGGKHIYSTIPLFYFQITPQKKREPVLWWDVKCLSLGDGTPVLLPRKSHGQRSLVGCGPWGCKESDTTEWLPFHFSLSCIGEGNGNPLQCSCLENPRDGGAWWAAVYGVVQSQTRLKWFSCSSRPGRLEFLGTSFVTWCRRKMMLGLPSSCNILWYHGTL